ncbi:MAG: GntR family transcriptional regulator [Hespellia sp.]|nr:GntR family transcriptional regulator [Hespellia sp.]
MSKVVSKYELIKNKILEKIEKGIYQENDKIPSENELCELFETSRITVRKALDELVTMGMLYRKHGVGTFVRAKMTEQQARDSKKILLVLPNYPELFSAGIVSSMLTGIHTEVIESRYMLVTLMEPRNEQDNIQFLDSIKSMQPDGIIYSFYFNRNLIRELISLNIPIVFLDSEPKDNPFDIVTGEDYESAYRVTNLLIMQGIKNVGFYSPWSDSFSTSYLRKKGIQQALEDSNVEWKEEWFNGGSPDKLFHEKISHIDMIAEIKNHLQKSPELEALILMNDSAAFSTFKAASELNLEIPKDIKLISYGNYNWSGGFAFVGLTTFEQHFKKYGQEAVKLLIKRMSGELPNMQQKRIIKYTLKRRNSF